MTPDVAQGLTAELRFILRPDWPFSSDPRRFTVSIPSTETDADIRIEIWRIASFVAYSDFVSITKLPNGTYVLASTNQSGNGFEIEFQKAKGIS